MNDLLQDVRHGLRTLWKQPGFTTVAVATLAIGIGANTAIFSVVERVLLEPFPYRAPHRLMVLWERNLDLGFPAMFVSPPTFTDWAERTESFEGLAAFTTRDVTLALDEPERVRAGRVSGGLFPLLGIEPAFGRYLVPEDDAPGAPRVVVVSRGFAERRFGDAAEVSVVGRVLRLDGEPYAIVGVMPASFSFPPPIALEGDLPPEPVEIWTPLALDYASGQRGAHYLSVIGRLEEGVGIETARAEMDTIAAALAEAYPSSNEGWDTVVTPLAEQVTGGLRPGLLVLFAATGFVLLIACVNVANLLLARGVARQREMAVRTALGAGRKRLVRQLLTESVLLSSMGGLSGLVLAFAGVRALVAIAPPNLPRLGEVGFDATAASFTAGICVAASLVFGLVPALSASSKRPFDGLRDREAQASGATRSWLGNGLVVAEVGLALVLLVAATLLIRSFSNLSTVDPGFRSQGVVTVRTTLPRAAYSDPGARVRFVERAVEALGRLPQVSRVGAVNEMPLAHDRQGTSVSIEGEPARPAGQETQTNFAVVSPGYFRAMGISLRRGRVLSSRDQIDRPRVVVVNEALGRMLFRDESPIGRRIHLGMSGGDPFEIVGVVGDVRHRALASEAVPNAYVPYAQQPRSYGMTFVIRTPSDPERLLGPVREAVRRLDASLPLFEVASLEGIVSQSIASPRFSMRLLSLFAVSAFLLAAVGLYGVVSHAVSQRVPEMGLRIALGANPARVARLVVAKGARLAGLGIAVGLLGASALTRALSSLLFGVSAKDPASFSLVAVTLLAVSLLAAYLPARRAARVDPIVALRAE